MKRAWSASRSFGIEHALRVVLAAAICGLAPRAGAIAELSGLGTPPEGAVSSQAWGVSADGSVVVGLVLQNTTPFPFPFPTYENHAFRWTAAGGMVVIGAEPGPDGIVSRLAYDVSADGSVVVGNGQSPASDGNFEAFRWTASDGIVGLGDFPGGSYFASSGQAVTPDGLLIAGSGYSTSGEEAMYWTEASGMVGLGDLPGGMFSSSALAVSADGRVIVGSGWTDRSPLEAFRWTQEEGMVSLGLPPGAAAGDSWAEGVSADGSVVVGNSDNFTTNQYEGFRWTADTGMQLLGDLPGGEDSSEAVGISADGSIVVGNSSSTDSVGSPFSGEEPFVWDPIRGMRSLRSLLTDAGVDTTDWLWLKATAISDDGRIVVGIGIHTSGGAQEAWRAVLPEPERFACNDGIDNDGDGKIDFDGGASANQGVALGPPDPGCAVPYATSENPQCDDGIDNDGNGLVDFADPKCSPTWPYWEKPPTLACGLGVELSVAAPLLAWLRRGRRGRAPG